MCGLCGIVEPGAPAGARARVDGCSTSSATAAPTAAGSSPTTASASGTCGSRSSTSPTPGLQPMTDRDGRLHLLHNGEVYNYLELRAELEAKGHRFRTRDRHRGDARRVPRVGRALRRALQRHVGVRALGRGAADALRLARPLRRQAVLLPARRRPALVRERAVRCSAATAPRREPGAPSATTSSRAGSTTATRRSSRASGGCRRRTTSSSGRDGLRLERYWRLEPHEAPADAAAGGARALPRRGPAPAAERRARRDRALGRHRLVRDRRRRRRPRARAPEDGHRVLRGRRLRRAAVRARRRRRRPAPRRTGSPSPRRSSSSNLPAIVRAQGEPFGSTSIAAGWHVMREAGRAGLTVMLDGQGGDELFAGLPGRLRLPARRPARARRGRRGCAASSARSGRGTARAPVAAAGVLARPFVPERLGAAARARLHGLGRARPRRTSARARAVLGRERQRLPRPAPPPSRARRSAAAGCPSCSATRTATRWRTRSRRASRSSTTGSSSSPTRSTARS